MFVTFLVIMAVVFVLTYDPKSRTLESVIEGSEPCCERLANNQTQCESVHYQGVQFGNENYGCPSRHPRQAMGAIIGT